MNTINLNSREQVLALAMDPAQSAFTFSEEDFDDDLTLNELARVNGGIAPLIIFGAVMLGLSFFASGYQAYKIATRD